MMEFESNANSLMMTMTKMTMMMTMTTMTMIVRQTFCPTLPFYSGLRGASRHSRQHYHCQDHGDDDDADDDADDADIQVQIKIIMRMRILRSVKEQLMIPKDFPKSVFYHHPEWPLLETSKIMKKIVNSRILPKENADVDGLDANVTFGRGDFNLKFSTEWYPSALLLFFILPLLIMVIMVLIILNMVQIMMVVQCRAGRCWMEAGQWQVSWKEREGAADSVPLTSTEPVPQLGLILS